MDDTVKLLGVQKFLTDDDVQVILSAPSEHLKYQSLLDSLQKFKLSIWIKISDLLRSKSLEHVSSQLMEGKCFLIHTHIHTRTHIYVYTM